MNKVYLVYSRYWSDKDWDIMFIYSSRKKATKFISDDLIEYKKTHNWNHEPEYKIIKKEVK